VESKVQGKRGKPHSHVTAGLIWKDGKVLIAKRPKGSHLEGFWEFPGGKQKKGESLRDCLEREVEEELGLKISADDPFLTVNHEYTHKLISLHTFNCTLVAGEAKPLQCEEIRWVKPIEFRKLHFPPPDLRVIEAICRFRYTHSKGC
jgi:mutator protein MutT